MIRFLSWGEGSKGWDGEASRDVMGVEGGAARLLEGVGLDPLTLAHYVVAQRSPSGRYRCSAPPQLSINYGVVLLGAVVHSCLKIGKPLPKFLRVD